MSESLAGLAEGNPSLCRAGQGFPLDTPPTKQASIGATLPPCLLAGAAGA